jgi:hypothetical protein
MKHFFLILFCFSLFVSNSYAQKNSADTTHYHNLNVCFTWFELGAGIPLKEKKLRDLPYGMNHYLYGPKAGFAGGGFGLGFFYKNCVGLSTIFTFSDFKVPDRNYKNYISAQYPGYFLPNNMQARIYTLYNINYRLSYRFHKGHFTYEPQFQLGINDYKEFSTHFVLKEEGSNNFVEYSIHQGSVKKNLFTYRAAVIARWRFSKPDWNWNVEPCLRVEFMILPTNFNYTITSTPYNMPPAIQEVQVKQMHPTLTITAGLSIFRK